MPCTSSIGLGCSRHTPGLSGGLERGVSGREDLLGSSLKLVLGRDVADSAVQANRTVMLDILGYDAQGFLQRLRRLQSDAFGLGGLVPTLHLAVALRIVGAGSHMGHARQANELFEVLGNELRAIVRDNPRPGLGEPLAGSLQHDLDVLFGQGPGHV